MKKLIIKSHRKKVAHKEGKRKESEDRSQALKNLCPFCFLFIPQSAFPGPDRPQCEYRIDSFSLKERQQFNFLISARAGRNQKSENELNLNFLSALCGFIGNYI